MELNNYKYLFNYKISSHSSIYFYDLNKKMTGGFILDSDIF